ncbi:MAG: hypothetical protein EOO78_19195 [Oxalobacteraceae bacterium]|nr:MAG: hypothetical protein EOO78_19195 [Oxalobacteraceae bacterium]
MSCFSVTHALDDRYAVGIYDTPLGSYAMEFVNGWGWLAAPASDFVSSADPYDGLPAPASPVTP